MKISKLPKKIFILADETAVGSISVRFSKDPEKNPFVIAWSSMATLEAWAKETEADGQAIEVNRDDLVSMLKTQTPCKYLLYDPKTGVKNFPKTRLIPL